MKIVREHIFERMGFTEDGDPIRDMGIGSIALFKKQLQKDADDADDIEYAYGETIRKFKRKYPGIDWEKIFNELSDNIYVNEAFTDDESDPIADMGIGGYSFETLRPGAIIKARRMGWAVTKNQSGQFTSWASGNKLWPESIILITNVFPYGAKDKNIYKDIRFRKYMEREADIAAAAKERMKNGEMAYGGQTGRMILSKKKFDYRFTVVQNGI